MKHLEKDTLTFVLAGGKGSRLGPLTEDIPKPMVPFAGRYKLIDFVMSNLYNSGLRKIYVLTQYEAFTLNRHVNRFWGDRVGHSGFCMSIQPQETSSGKNWYEHTAHAIAQNIKLIKKENPKYVAIFGADHIYNMDVTDILNKHQKKGAALSISALEVSLDKAREFGVFEVDTNSNLVDFKEKPQNPAVIPGKDTVLASMGNYIFDTEALIDALEKNDHVENLDFGGHIIPYMINKNKKKVNIYNFSKNNVPGLNEHSKGYWCDVGTLEAYYDASMALNDPVPVLDLYNDKWEILSHTGQSASARTSVGASGETGFATESYTGNGSTISGGRVHRSILSPRVYVGDRSRVEGSILLDNVTVGDNVLLRGAIVSPDVKIPSGFRVGEDYHYDLERGLIVPKLSNRVRVIHSGLDLERLN